MSSNQEPKNDTVAALDGPAPESTEELIQRWASQPHFRTTVSIDLPAVGLLTGDEIECLVDPADDYSAGELILFPYPGRSNVLCIGRLCRVNRKTLVVTCEHGKWRLRHPPIIAHVKKIIRAGTGLEHNGPTPPIQNHCANYIN
jgi:hypothetical protein